MIPEVNLNLEIGIYENLSIHLEKKFGHTQKSIHSHILHLYSAIVFMLHTSCYYLISSKSIEQHWLRANSELPSDCTVI